jgi:RimJ/RimL family protein N-acetyltransferase
MSAGPAYRVETQRLVLRAWQPLDAAKLSRAVEESLEHLRPTMPWIQLEPLTLDQRLALLRRLRADFDRDADFVYAVFDPTEESVLGGTGLHARVGPGALEIGYWIHVAHTGKGLATEAAAALTRVALEVHRVDRVEIHCGPDNPKSAGVPRKLGFTLEATLRRRGVTGIGDPRDTMIWSLFPDAAAPAKTLAAQARAFDALGRRLF